MKKPRVFIYDPIKLFNEQNGIPKISPHNQAFHWSWKVLPGFNFFEITFLVFSVHRVGYFVKESCGHVAIVIVRENGADGDVQVQRENNP